MDNHQWLAVTRRLLWEFGQERRKRSMEGTAADRSRVRPSVGNRPLPANPMFGKGRR